MDWLENYSFNIEANSLVSKDKAPKKVKENIPEWALYFKAVASNGDENRNGYIIRAKAWITNALGKKDTSFIDHYLENWKILYQHNSEKPIWKPLSLKVVGDELILEAWVYDDNYTDWNIARWLVTSISTWHITHNREFEHQETKQVLQEEEFFDEYDFWDLAMWGGKWLMAVTSAEVVENSLVTIGSNRDSHIINSKSYLINKLWMSEDQFNILLSKDKSMNKKDILEMKGVNFPKTNDVEEVETDEEVTDTEEVVDETIETEEVVETEEETTDTPEVEEEVETDEEEPVKENKVKKEEKQISLSKNEFEKLLTSAISTLKNELQNEFNLKVNELKEEKRNDLATIVKDAVKGEETDAGEDLKNALRK